MASFHSGSVGMIQVRVIKGKEGSERLQYVVVVGLIDPWKKVSWKA